MSDKELELDTNRLLITKTDLNGKLIYCNQSFIEVSGFNEEQLFNQHFESIKHTDMPNGIFHLMWQTVRQKKEFNGYLKFRCHNGDSYWTFTNVTPFYNVTGSIAGYTYAMRQPNAAATMMFSMYYEQMKEQENGQSSDSSAKSSLKLLIDLLSAMGDDYEASVFKLQFS